MIYHIDDAVPKNANEAHPTIAVVNADGLRQPEKTGRTCAGRDGGHQVPRRGLDRHQKRELYLREMTALYWIVDPGSELVEVWTLGDDRPRIETEIGLWSTRKCSADSDIAVQSRNEARRSAAVMDLA